LVAAYSSFDSLCCTLTLIQYYSPYTLTDCTPHWLACNGPRRLCTRYYLFVLCMWHRSSVHRVLLRHNYSFSTS